MKLSIKNSLAVLLVFTALCAEAQVLSLDNILVAVSDNNPALKEYDNRARALQAYAEGAEGLSAPMVGVSTFLTPYPGQMLEERDKGMLMFSVEQEISSGGRRRASRNYLESQAQVEDFARAARFNLLRAQTKTAYYSWLVAERKLHVLNESKAIVNLMLRIANIRYPYNQSTLGSIYKAEARLHEIENMQLMVQGEIEEQRYRLAGLMNIPVTTTFTIDTTVSISASIAKTNADTLNLSQQRSDIRQLEQSIQAMRLNQEVQQLQTKPNVRLRFDHMEPFGNMPRQYNAMVMVSIPIAPWSAKSYKANIKGMEYDIESMKQEQKSILTEARSMVAAMTAQLNRMATQLENYDQKIIPALRKNYQAVMLAYEENQEQLPAVIDAWEALNMAQLEYLDKMKEYLQMIVTYERELEQ